MDSATRVTFSAEFQSTGPGGPGHRLPAFIFRFSGPFAWPEGGWPTDDGAEGSYYLRKFDSKLRSFGHFYQGEEPNWLFIEFWTARNKLAELKLLFDEMVADLRALGLTQLPPQDLMATASR